MFWARTVGKLVQEVDIYEYDVSEDDGDLNMKAAAKPHLHLPLPIHP